MRGLSWTEYKNPLGWLSHAPDPRYIGIFAWSINIQHSRSEEPVLEVDKPDSIHKTAAGQFEFLRLPFDLKNLAASFHRLMEFVLKDIRGKCCFVYIDDIVVYSKNEQEHLPHLDQVFNCLQQSGLTLNLKKCNLVQRSLTFLGHVVSSEGIKTDPSKVEAICDFPVPQSLKDLQRFL